MRLGRVLFGKIGWNRIVAEAEKLVGNNSGSSYSSAQHLLSDEIAQVALNVRKLISSGHPLLKTARHLYSSENFVHVFGLTVLLVSRATSTDRRSNAEVHDEWNGILESQRSLADITELVYTANFIHRGILNDDEMATKDAAAKKLIMGNKMAVLGGDLLLANASVALSKLRNPFVVNAVARGIADMTLSQFVDDRQTMSTTERWEKQVYLGAGSLLANSCRSTVRLAGENDRLEMAAFDFAKNLAFVMALYYNSNSDLTTDERESDWTKSRTIFPLLRLSDDETRTLASKYRSTALKHLEPFPENVTKQSLIEMTSALAEL